MFACACVHCCRLITLLHTLFTVSACAEHSSDSSGNSVHCVRTQGTTHSGDEHRNSLVTVLTHTVSIMLQRSLTSLFTHTRHTQLTLTLLPTLTCSWRSFHHSRIAAEVIVVNSAAVASGAAPVHAFIHPVQKKKGMTPLKSQWWQQTNSNTEQRKPKATARADAETAGDATTTTKATRPLSATKKLMQYLDTLKERGASRQELFAKFKQSNTQSSNSSTTADSTSTPGFLRSKHHLTILLQQLSGSGRIVARVDKVRGGHNYVLKEYVPVNPRIAMLAKKKRKQAHVAPAQQCCV